MADGSPAPRAPYVLLTGIVLKAVWLFWLGWHGFPLLTSDSPCFKQPAYMRLFTPNYSIPSYAGHGPYAELINSYPSTVYTYANYLVFKVFGFSQFSSISIDLTIHFLISALGAWALWRLTGSQVAALVYLLASSQWLLPFGRPEEFGALLILLAVVTLERGPIGFALTLLAVGFAGASSPGAAIVATALLVPFEVLQRGVSKNRTRLLALLLIPVLISGILYVGYVYPYLSEALEQDRHMRDTNFYYRVGLIPLLRGQLLWALGTFPVLLAAIALAAIGIARPPKWFPSRTTAGNFVIAAGIAVAAGLALNVVAERPTYDYRHIIAISVAALAVATAWLQTAGRVQRVAAWGLAGLIVLLSLPPQQMIVRQSLGLLTWTDEDFDFAKAKTLVNQVVPKDATVGGDGNAWAMIDDGRPFLLVRTVAPAYWPEYVVSTAWANPPAVSQRPIDVSILKNHYEELTLTPALPCDGCSLNLGGLKLPIASGRCDWYPRIWKRRSPIDVGSLPPRTD